MADGHAANHQRQFLRVPDLVLIELDDDIAGPQSRSSGRTVVDHLFHESTVRRAHTRSSRLRFRDRLRADQALATEYVALKRALAARYPEDRDTYTEAKAPFIKRVERQAGLDASVARPRV